VIREQSRIHQIDRGSSLPGHDRKLTGPAGGCGTARAVAQQLILIGGEGRERPNLVEACNRSVCIRQFPQSPAKLDQVLSVNNRSVVLQFVVVLGVFGVALLVAATVEGSQ